MIRLQHLYGVLFFALLVYVLDVPVMVEGRSSMVSTTLQDAASVADKEPLSIQTDVSNSIYERFLPKQHLPRALVSVGLSKKMRQFVDTIDEATLDTSIDALVQTNQKTIGGDYPLKAQASEELYGSAWTDYVASVVIDGEPFDVILDTGSSSLAIASSAEAGCARWYSPSSSSTCDGPEMSMYYGSGNWTGRVCHPEREVSIAGLSAGRMRFAGIETQVNMLQCSTALHPGIAEEFTYLEAMKEEVQECIDSISSSSSSSSKRCKSKIKQAHKAAHDAGHSQSNVSITREGKRGSSSSLNLSQSSKSKTKVKAEAQTKARENARAMGTEVTLPRWTSFPHSLRQRTQVGIAGLAFPALLKRDNSRAAWDAFHHAESSETETKKSLSFHPESDPLSRANEALSPMYPTFTDSLFGSLVKESNIDPVFAMRFCGWRPSSSVHAMHSAAKSLLRAKSDSSSESSMTSSIPASSKHDDVLRSGLGTNRGSLDLGGVVDAHYAGRIAFTPITKRKFFETAMMDLVLEVPALYRVSDGTLVRPAYSVSVMDSYFRRFIATTPAGKERMKFLRATLSKRTKAMATAEFVESDTDESVSVESTPESDEKSLMYFQQIYTSVDTFARQQSEGKEDENLENVETNVANQQNGKSKLSSTSRAKTKPFARSNSIFRVNPTFLERPVHYDHPEQLKYAENHGSSSTSEPIPPVFPFVARASESIASDINDFLWSSPAIIDSGTGPLALIPELFATLVALTREAVGVSLPVEFWTGRMCAPVSTLTFRSLHQRGLTPFPLARQFEAMEDRSEMDLDLDLVWPTIRVKMLRDPADAAEELCEKELGDIYALPALQQVLKQAYAVQKRENNTIFSDDETTKMRNSNDVDGNIQMRTMEADSTISVEDYLRAAVQARVDAVATSLGISKRQNQKKKDLQKDQKKDQVKESKGTLEPDDQKQKEKYQGTGEQYVKEDKMDNTMSIYTPSTLAMRTAVKECVAAHLHSAHGTHAKELYSFLAQKELSRLFSTPTPTPAPTPSSIPASTSATSSKDSLPQVATVDILIPPRRWMPWAPALQCPSTTRPSPLFGDETGKRKHVSSTLSSSSSSSSFTATLPLLASKEDMNQFSDKFGGSFCLLTPFPSINILGQAALEGTYTVFEVAKGRVGFAHAKGCSSETTRKSRKEAQHENATMTTSDASILLNKKAEKHAKRKPSNMSGEIVLAEETQDNITTPKKTTHKGKDVQHKNAENESQEMIDVTTTEDSSVEEIDTDNTTASTTSPAPSKTQKYSHVHEYLFGVPALTATSRFNWTLFIILTVICVIFALLALVPAIEWIRTVRARYNGFEPVPIYYERGGRDEPTRERSERR